MPLPATKPVRCCRGYFSLQAAKDGESIGCFDKRRASHGTVAGASGWRMARPAGSGRQPMIGRGYSAMVTSLQDGDEFANSTAHGAYFQA